MVWVDLQIIIHEYKNNTEIFFNPSLTLSIMAHHNIIVSARFSEANVSMIELKFIQQNSFISPKKQSKTIGKAIICRIM